MTTDLNLQFIREKIKQLRTAVMYSMSNSLLKLPNTIVSALKVDDEGNLWFICRTTVNELELKEYEQSFPVRLCFYRKGVDFRLEVSGKATIMNNQFITTEEAASDSGNYKVLLFKMNMLNIEYTEPHTRRPESRMESWLKHSYKWLLRNAAVPRTSISVLTKLHQTNYN